MAGLRATTRAVALAVAMTAGAAGTAQADQTVVSATVYPGSQGTVSTPSVGLAALQNCPAYTGPNPVYLYPGGQPWQAPSGSTWTLSTVVQCGLGIPTNDVGSVQVDTLHQGYEAPLSADDLTDTGAYQDPQAPGALPVIASDGGEDQNSYFRPWRGATDNNARDEVVQSNAPVSIVVYATGALLRVAGSQHVISRTSSTATVGLSATVRAQDGSAVPASSLSWSWNFGDGGTSTAPAPAHTFADGVYYSTVQVTDNQTGSGGTATIQVTTPAAGKAGPSTRPGARHHTGSRSPAGTDTGRRRTPSTQSSHSRTTPAPAATTPATTPVATPSPAATTPEATTPATTRPKPTPHPRPRLRARTRRRPTPAPLPAGSRIVSGRVLTGVTAQDETTSPLVHAATSPAPAGVVRSATAGPGSLTGAGAAAAVVGLLGLGAGRELRGRRRWRLPRSGH